MRLLNRIYAFLGGYFWLPCPVCGENFGGHEASFNAVLVDDGTARCVCYKESCNHEAMTHRQTDPRYFIKLPAELGKLFIDSLPRS